MVFSIKSNYVDRKKRRKLFEYDNLKTKQDGQVQMDSYKAQANVVM